MYTKPFPAEDAPRNYGNREAVPNGPVVVSILQAETLPTDGRILVASLDEAFPSDAFLAPGDTELRFGRIRWRVGRRIQEADFDLKAGGTVFAISADWVEIFVVRLNDPPAVTLDYEASFTLAYGVPNLWPPTRTVSVSVAPGTTSALFAIPHKAVAVRLLMDDDQTASMDSFDGKGMGVGAINNVLGNNSPGPPMPVAQGARTFNVSLAAAAPANVQFTIVWDLGL